MIISLLLPLLALANPFEDLQSWFSQGAPVTFNEFSRDYHVGRCFAAETPEKPEAVLAATYELRGEDRGPAFPPESQKKVFLLSGNPRYGAEAFDTFPYLPGGEDGPRAFDQGAQRNWNYYSEVDANLAFFDDINLDGTFDTRYETVRYKQYFITKITSVAAPDAGTVLRVCYYFKSSPRL